MWNIQSPINNGMMDLDIITNYMLVLEKLLLLPKIPLPLPQQGCLIFKFLNYPSKYAIDTSNTRFAKE